ncbi:MAG TPA: hypothetical protein VGA95_13290 [Thermodesulfobacteriota bacterium]
MLTVELIYDADCPNMNEVELNCFAPSPKLDFHLNGRNGIVTLLRVRLTCVPMVPQPSWLRVKMWLMLRHPLERTAAVFTYLKTDNFKVPLQ